jgi:putative inorganic carbon (hco3(-)) transporter
MPSLLEPSSTQQASTTNPSKTPPLLIFLIALIIPIILSYELITVKESFVFAITLATIGGLIIFARPFWGLILFIALLYIRPEESIQEIQGVRLPFIISIITLVSTLIHKLVNNERLVKSQLNLLITGFALCVVISAFQTYNIESAFLDMSKNAILVLLIINLVDSPGKYRIFYNSLTSMTGFIAIYSMYLYLTGNVIIRGNQFQSIGTGIFADPNDLSATIVAGLGMTLFQMRSNRRSVQIFNFVLSIIFFIAIIFTNSRGGLLAALCAFCIFIYQTSLKKKVAIIVIILVPLLIIASLGGRITNFDSNEASANSRFWFWTNGIESFIQKPLLGIGYNGFGNINAGMTAHNSFVLCFTETGILGYFFWISSIVYSLTASCFRDTKKDYISKNSEVLLFPGSKLALIGYLLAVIWISRTYTSNLYILIASPAAYYLSHNKSDNTNSEQHKINIFRILSICVISIIALYIIAIMKR